MLRCLMSTLLLAAPAVAQQGVDDAVPKLAKWFAALAAERGAPPVVGGALSRAEAEAAVPALWAAYRDACREVGMDTLPPLLPNDLDRALEPSVLELGEHTMPYVLLVKGEKPAGGWPLYLCLHGGGGNGEAKGPHAWGVNDREWQAQQTLWRRLYPAPGIYFIPRMADDRLGRWWHDHNQVAFERVIERAILFRDVDPDRVYLMGISEGGYGAIRFAGNLPDRFAGCGGMAAAEPLNTSPPEDMRNVAMRIDIGENDTMFDRVGLARCMGERLAELHAADPGGYDFAVNVQAGRGHGIDYSLTPRWLSTKVRDPRPQRVLWTVRPFDHRVALQRHWLALDAAPAAMPWFVTAALDGQRLTLTVERPAGGDAGREPVTTGIVRVRLDDRLLDLDQPVELVLNGGAARQLRVERRLDVLARTLAERSDPELAFCAELVVDLAAR
ncbi:MAG: hypothetical protein R3F29_08590 [Planctomycetota bacterium]